MAEREVDFKRMSGEQRDFKREQRDGVYAVGKNLSVGQRVKNSTIRIVGVNQRLLADDNIEEILICSIRCSEAWGTREEEIEVSSENFKGLFSFIRKKFRDIFVLQSRSEVLEEYLSAVNRRDFNENNSKLNRKITSAVIGWSQIDGEVRYRLGDGSFYSGYFILVVNSENRFQIFQKGFAMRGVGHENEVAEMLWLFLHSPYVLGAVGKLKVNNRSSE